MAELHLGRIDRALEQALQARASARDRGARGAEAWASWLLAEIASRRDPVGGRAEELYWQALGLAEELGMRPLQAHCHRGLGKLYRQVGRGEEARAELARAADMLREMGMSFWLPQAEAELAEAIASPSVKRGG